MEWYLVQLYSIPSPILIFSPNRYSAEHHDEDLKAELPSHFLVFNV